MLLKADDDTFVNMVRVDEVLKELDIQPGQPWYAGMLSGPIKTAWDQLNLRRMFHCPKPYTFPRFFHVGVGYFMSRSIVDAVIAQHDYEKRAPCQAEDRYVARLIEMSKYGHMPPETRLRKWIYPVTRDQASTTNSKTAGCLLLQKYNNINCTKTDNLLSYILGLRQQDATLEGSPPQCSPANGNVAAILKDGQDYDPVKGYVAPTTQRDRWKARLADILT